MRRFAETAERSFARQLDDGAGDDAHVLLQAFQTDVFVGLMSQLFFSGEDAAESHALVQTLGIGAAAGGLTFPGQAVSS